jgi:serine/threonine protein kinase
MRSWDVLVATALTFVRLTTSTQLLSDPTETDAVPNTDARGEPISNALLKFDKRFERGPFTCGGWNIELQSLADPTLRSLWKGKASRPASRNQASRPSTKYTVSIKVSDLGLIDATGNALVGAQNARTYFPHTKNIQHIWSTCQRDGYQYIVGDWYDGSTVKDAINRNAYRRNEDLTARHIEEAIGALATIHSKGFAFNDFWVENMMLDHVDPKQATVHLIDFDELARSMRGGRVCGLEVVVSPGKSQLESELWNRLLQLIQNRSYCWNRYSNGQRCLGGRRFHSLGDIRPCALVGGSRPDCEVNIQAQDCRRATQENLGSILCYQRASLDSSPHLLPSITAHQV